MTVLSTPKLDDGKTSWGYSPLVHMLRLYTKYIQDLFSNPNPLNLVFSHDEETTDIIIKAANSVNSEVIDKNPVVLIHRSAFGLPPSSLHGDMSDLDIKTGQVTREAMLEGGMFFSVITNNDLFADDIAWWIVENIWLLRNIETDALFQGAQNFNISPPSSPQGLVQGDFQTKTAVQVSFTTKILRTSRVAPGNLKRLKQIDVTLKDKATGDTLVEVETS